MQFFSKLLVDVYVCIFCVWITVITYCMVHVPVYILYMCPLISLAPLLMLLLRPVFWGNTEAALELLPFPAMLPVGNVETQGNFHTGIHVHLIQWMKQHECHSVLMVLIIIFYKFMNINYAMFHLLIIYITMQMFSLIYFWLFSVSTTPCIWRFTVQW